MKVFVVYTAVLLANGQAAFAQYTPQQIALYQQQQQQHQSHHLGFGNILRGMGNGRQNNTMSPYPIYGQPIYGNQMPMQMQMGSPMQMNNMQFMQTNNPLMPQNVPLRNGLPVTQMNFGNGMSNIQTPSGPVSINRVGSMEYINGANGYNETVQNVGRTSYYNGSGGNGTIQHVGNFDYFNGSNGSGTMEHLGNFGYYNGSDGSHYTTNRVGNMTYINP